VARIFQLGFLTRRYHRGFAQHLGQTLARQTAFLAEGEGLGQRLDAQPQQRVGTQLHRGAGASGTEVERLAPEDGEDRLTPLVNVFVATDEDYELSLLRLRRASRDRRVEHC